MNMRKITILALSLSSIFVVGCSGASGESEGGDVQAELIASPETLSQYGIGKWQVLLAGQSTVRFVGRGNDGRDLAQIQVENRADASARVVLLKPEIGEADVDREGAIIGDITPSAHALLQALYADTGVAKDIDARPRSDSAQDSVGVSQQALSIGYQGHIAYWGGWFGYRDNYNVGGWCPNGGARSGADAFSDNGASCWINRWASSQPNDCTVSLHLGINAFASDVCHWYVYQTP
jgi:hypothetical protein